ncbi:MAG: transposase [Aquabacterium sp.]|nr:hypothetical protein [Stenotrophomonas maltophilia]MBP6612567.1 transposase [Aquabacterium sp.]
MAQGSAQAPAEWFEYSLDRKGSASQAHLQDFTNVLQADGMRGFEAL